MKKFQLEVWNTFDKLCLMSSITKLKTSFADQNWVAISRYTKQLHENISSFIQYDTRSDEWFSAKQCSAQYEVLIKSSGARKKKKVDRNFDYSDVHEALLVSINQEFCKELQLSLGDIRDEFLQTKQLIEELDDDKIDDERLEELINEFLETEKSDIKSKLKSMLDEKNAAECEHNKYGSQPLVPNEPSTSSEPKATNITTSPLLTSLLQSPSPLVRPSPSTSSPTISLLLHSSPSVSLADPTLSKLLESPTSVPGTSNISSLETPSFLFQGAASNSQQSSETKKKQSDGGEDVSVQRIINDPVEFQRTAEGFDDMSDLEQGVVESEVIIENESSPIKRLTPRRLDLENVGDEEQEEEILETVEEIIERVEEAIIETVGENNLNELVLNEGIDTVSISDEDIENMNIEDNTYEVIVVGSQEEAIPSSSEVSETPVVIDGSISKVDKKKDVDSDTAKNSEIMPVDDQIITDATPKPVNNTSVEICNEVSSENEVSQEKMYTEKEKPKPEINIIDKGEKELSSNLIIGEEKSVENIDTVHGKCLGRQSEDFERDSSLTEENSSAVSSIVEPSEHTVPSTLEGNNHSIPESVDEVLIDKQDNVINECQKITHSSLPSTQPVEQIMLLENKFNEPKVMKLTEGIPLVLNDSEVKDKYHDEVIKAPAIEMQSEKIEVSNDGSNQILDKKEKNFTEIDYDLLEPRGEKKQSELHNEEVSSNGLNLDRNSKEASKSEEMVMDSQQSAVMPSLTDEKDSASTDVLKQNDFSQENDEKSRTDLENKESVETAGICKDQVVHIDSDSGSSKELVVDNNEIKNITPIINPNVSGESKLSIEQPEKKDISKLIECNLVSDISETESKQEQVITKNKTSKDEIKNKSKVDICDLKKKNLIIDDEKKSNSENIENNISSIEIPEESHKAKEILDTEETNEVQETHQTQAQENLESQETQEVQESQKALEVQESQKALETEGTGAARENQETDEVQESNEVQESHDDFCERNSSQTYIESDESKSDSTEETEDNSILTTEDSKDGLDDSLKFSSLETLSMPSVDSPPELTDPKFAGLNRKEKEFRSLIGKGFEELKSKAAELVYIPESPKHGKAKSKARMKKDKAFKTKKMVEKTNWEKSTGSKINKEKTNKERASNKERSNNEKHANSSRKAKYLSSIDSKPDSPSPSTTSSDEDRDYKSWKKSILLVYNRLASHKYASVFSKPITENEAPSYHQLILRPMDLSTIKRNIENGVIRTTVEFQRDMLLMVQNAIIYNKYDTPVYDMAKAMGEDMLAQMEVMVQALGDGVPLIGDTSEEKQITRARTSKSSVETPTSKKRKTQDPDEIRPKRNKLSTPC